MGKNKPLFDYSLGVDLTITDLLFGDNFADELRRVLRKLPIIHGGDQGCHKKVSIRTNDTEITGKCDCGTFVLYPPRLDRGKMYMAVTFKENQNGKDNNRSK